MNRGTNTSIVKSAPVDLTAGDNGTISGYFATFDHDRGDSYGDVIRKGAFLGTIARRKQSGHPFPMCFNHDLNIIIGIVTDIGEDSRGAWFKAKFFSTDKAQEIRSIVKSKAVWQMSFCYDVLKQGPVKAGDGTTVNELRELELYEISIVTIPANSRAVITEVKNEQQRSAKAERLLDYIHGMQKQDSVRKQALLRSIAEHEAADAAEDLEKLHAELDLYKGMEQQALEDIRTAKQNGLREWGRKRSGALHAIRKQINRLEEIIANQKAKHSRTKAGRCASAERIKVS